MPSCEVTLLPSMARRADRMAVETPEVSFSEHEGLAPSQIIPVKFATMFFTAAQQRE